VDGNAVEAPAVPAATGRPFIGRRPPVNITGGSLASFRCTAAAASPAREQFGRAGRGLGQPGAQG
jgi:hypothetical protein